MATRNKSVAPSNRRTKVLGGSTSKKTSKKSAEREPVRLYLDEEYSEKAFVIFGTDTEVTKKHMKALKGLIRPYWKSPFEIKKNGKSQAIKAWGVMFPLIKLEDVKASLELNYKVEWISFDDVQPSDLFSEEELEEHGLK